MSQKYYIFVPDIEDVKTWSKKGESGGEKLGSLNLLSRKIKCLFVEFNEKINKQPSVILFQFIKKPILMINF
ncbi:hypothetical protein BpHYR1_012580 [Brachionus plicatilis]|uniref:Uncharacterized protein n=1 Tax=Brachionus plicatilis TaxID=10195 RepID=A0A3M7T2G2_BRAPC|nr:hypothetical protein BpHYR1_012580 [Brachionus plicatilis]